MSDGTTKPIEDIRPGDWLVSFDKDGNRVPGRVRRTFENESKFILDYFGTFVTPGHVYRVVDGPNQGEYMPLIEILRSDAAIVTEEGRLVRAATRCELGSIGDRFVWAVLGEDAGDGRVRVADKARLRLGSRVMLPDGKNVSLHDLIASGGGFVDDDGLIRTGDDDEVGAPFHWTLTDRLPRPEDYVLQRSCLTLEDIYAADEWEAPGPTLPPPTSATSGHPGAPARTTSVRRSGPNIPLALLGRVAQTREGLLTARG